MALGKHVQPDAQLKVCQLTPKPRSAWLWEPNGFDVETAPGSLPTGI